MGGKSSTSTSKTSIPPEVLAQYNSVNSVADTVAQTPFQQYSSNPDAFVAPLDATQQAGILGTNQSSNMAQPYYAAGAGLTMAGAGSANPEALTGQDIGQYFSPYLGTVVGNTASLMNQQNQQAQAGQLGNAINSGAFGGDRAGVAAANLQQQNAQAEGNVLGGLLNTGYNTALSTAQQQQGVDLSAQQANLARLSAAGQQIAGLGTGAQTAGLTGAQAQLAAGQTQQQTSQAGLTALYNQFLQQQGYPFQVTQFLANIAEGTGALSGSTTTTTQPSPFFSDARLKDNIEPIGKTFDGENIVKFSYKGSPQKHIGLLAQDVEKRHPEAVGLAGGYKTVDYDEATKDAAIEGRKHFGNLERPKLAAGGSGGGPISIYDYANMLAAQQQGYEKAPWGQAGLYGGNPQSGAPGRGSYVPSSNLPVAHLVTPQSVGATKPQSDLAQLAQAAQQASQITSAAQGVSKGASNLGDWWKTQNAVAAPPPAVIPTDNGAGLGSARGGRQYRDAGGSTQDTMPYENDNEIGIPDKQSAATKLALAKAGIAPSSSQSSPFSQIAGLAGGVNSLVNLPGTLGTVGSAIGTAASTAGGDIMAMLPFLGLANGGSAGNVHNLSGDILVPGVRGSRRDSTLGDIRHGYADGGTDDDPNASDDAMLAAILPKDATGKPVAAPVVADPGTAAPAASVAPPPLPPERPKNLGEAPVAIVPRQQTNGVSLGDVAASNELSAAPQSDIGAATQPRSVRNNNPGNIVDGPFAQRMPGYKGTDGQFAIFATPEAGANATDVNLQAYAKKGLDTPASIISSWAPPNAPGNSPKGTGNYINYVSSKLGIGPNDKIDMTDPTQRAAVSSAIAEWEGGTGQPGIANKALNGFTADASKINAPGSNLGDVASNVGNAVTQGGKNVGDWFGQNQNWMVPLLSGLGTMASSNSRYLGSALLQGLGGAATSYEGVQNQEAERARQQASTQQTQASTLRGSYDPSMGGLIWIKDPVTGQPRISTWQEYSQLTKSGKSPEILSGQNVPGGTGTPVISPQQTAKGANDPVAGGMPSPAAPPPPAPPKAPLGVGYDDDSRKTAQADSIAGPTFAQKQAFSGQYLTGTTAQADAARSSVPYTQELANIIAQANANPSLLNSPGYGQQFRSNIVNIANSLSRMWGGPENALGQSDTWDQIVAKINTLQGLSRSQGAGLESTDAFNQLKSANPDLAHTPEASATLVAQLMADQVKAKDRALHMQQYGEDSGGSLVNAPNDFDKKNGPQKYNVEREQIKDLILNNPKAFQLMSSGNLTSQQIAEGLAARHYSPALARYFATAGAGG